MFPLLRSFRRVHNYSLVILTRQSSQSNKSDFVKWGRATPDFESPYDKIFYKKHGKTPDEVRREHENGSGYGCVLVSNWS